MVTRLGHRIVALPHALEWLAARPFWSLAPVHGSIVTGAPFVLFPFWSVRQRKFRPQDVFVLTVVEPLLVRGARAWVDLLERPGATMVGVDTVGQALAQHNKLAGIGGLAEHLGRAAKHCHMNIGLPAAMR